MEIWPRSKQKIRKRNENVLKDWIGKCVSRNLEKSNFDFKKIFRKKLSNSRISNSISQKDFPNKACIKKMMKIDFRMHNFKVKVNLRPYWKKRLKRCRTAVCQCVATEPNENNPLKKGGIKKGGNVYSVWPAADRPPGGSAIDSSGWSVRGRGGKKDVRTHTQGGDECERAGGMAGRSERERTHVPRSIL